MQSAFDNIIVCDVGGTNVRFGLVSVKDDYSYHLTDFIKFSDSHNVNFEGLLDQYIAQLKFRPRLASFGFAGPKTGDTIHVHSRGWRISQSELKSRFDFENVLVSHDFGAMTRSIPALSGDDFAVIAEGKPMADHPVLCAGPGTGFGTAILFPTRQGWEVVSGEGGYMAYPPQTPEEFALFDILHRKHAFVSLELIASGRGMDDVHEAICERNDVPYQKAEPGELIARAHNGDPIAQELCRVRSRAIMGAIGDLTAVHGARGGAVLAGGVSERLLDFLKAETAMNRFYNRDRLSDYIQDVPIKVLTRQEAPLIGAGFLFQDKFG